MIMGHFINVYKLKKEGEKGTPRRKEAIVRREVRVRFEVGDQVEPTAKCARPGNPGKRVLGSHRAWNEVASHFI